MVDIIHGLFRGFGLAIINDIDPPAGYTDEAKRLIKSMNWLRNEKVNSSLLSHLRDETVMYQIKDETLNLIKQMNYIHKSSIQIG